MYYIFVAYEQKSNNFIPMLKSDVTDSKMQFVCFLIKWMRTMHTENDWHTRKWGFLCGKHADQHLLYVRPQKQNEIMPMICEFSNYKLNAFYMQPSCKCKKITSHILIKHSETYN